MDFTLRFLGFCFVPGCAFPPSLYDANIHDILHLPAHNHNFLSADSAIKMTWAKQGAAPGSQDTAIMKGNGRMTRDSKEMREPMDRIQQLGPAGKEDVHRKIRR